MMSSIAADGNDGNDGQIQEQDNQCWASIAAEPEPHPNNRGLVDEQQLALNQRAMDEIYEIRYRINRMSEPSDPSDLSEPSDPSDPRNPKLNPDDIGVHFKRPTTGLCLVKMCSFYYAMFNSVVELGRTLESLEHEGKGKDKDKGKGKGKQINAIMMSNMMRSVKKAYNRRLTVFLSILSETSPLRHLLFVDNKLQFVSKKSPRIKKHVDLADPYTPIVDGFKEGEDRTGYVLRVKGDLIVGGGRVFFDTPGLFLDALKAMMVKSTSWNTHVVKLPVPSPSPSPGSSLRFYRYNGWVEPYGSFGLDAGSFDLYTLRMFIDNNHWIDAYDSKLIHILCDGNPPRNDDICRRQCPKSDAFHTLYPLLAEYLRLVREQILQVIRNSYSNPDCPFATIHCCRAEPACNGETIIRKVVDGGSTLRNCGLCNIELCGHGCGKIHHGNAPCEVSLDEASEAFIQETMVPCPQCGINIGRLYGSNHLTCQCGCQLCWICGVEMPRDEHGHYRTELHFGVNGDGINGDRINGGCVMYA